MDKPQLKPGEFWARCSLTKPHPISELPHYLRREYEEKGWKRAHREAVVKRRLKHTECYLEPLCAGFETTDKAAFEQHMREVHGKRQVSGENASLVARATGRWRTPRPGREGAAYTPTKALAGLTTTCACCGLVMENGSTLADERFVTEHLEHCVAQAGAA